MVVSIIGPSSMFRAMACKNSYKKMAIERGVISLNCLRPGADLRGAGGLTPPPPDSQFWGPNFPRDSAARCRQTFAPETLLHKSWVRTCETIHPTTISGYIDRSCNKWGLIDMTETYRLTSCFIISEEPSLIHISVPRLTHVYLSDNQWTRNLVCALLLQ